MLGIYARSDVERGVFEAPSNEVVRGAIDVEFNVTEGNAGYAQPEGGQRHSPLPRARHPRLGRRTMASDAEWKYINVRRLFIFLERSIDEGTQWAVFEPNDERLWGRVTDTIRRSCARSGEPAPCRAKPNKMRSSSGTTCNHDAGRHRQRAAHLSGRRRDHQAREFVIFRIVKTGSHVSDTQSRNRSACFDSVRIRPEISRKSVEAVRRRARNLRLSLPWGHSRATWCRPSGACGNSPRLR